MNAPNIKTADGRVTHYGFRCGYVDDIAPDVRIEGLPYGRGILARAEGGRLILYCGPSVTAARKACRDYVRGRIAAHELDEGAPHGADCAMRFSAAAECTCGKADALAAAAAAAAA